MSEEHVDAGNGGNHHHHDEVEIERIETVSNGRVPWAVRLIFGILGIVLLASAFAAWEFRALFDAHIVSALPYIIAALGVLGIGAIVESVTTELWMTIIAAAAALAITFLIVGRMQVFPDQGTVYLVDRFTGAVQFCTPDGCKPLPTVKELPKPDMAMMPPPAMLPPPGAMMPPAAAPAGEPAAAAPVPVPVAPAPVVPPPAKPAPAKK